MERVSGLFPAGQSDAGAPIQVNSPTTIQVWVGGFLATLAYHGRSGDAGLDQINFSVPFGVSGCSIPIVVQESGTTPSQ